MNKLPFMRILKHYSPAEVLKSFATALIFYLLLGGIFIVPTSIISALYVPFMVYFVLGMFIALSIITSYAVHIFVQTLKQYKELKTIPYEVFATRSSVFIASITFVVLAIIYIQYLE